MVAVCIVEKLKLTNMGDDGMSDKQFYWIAGAILFIVFAVFGLKFWSKNELCSVYYSDMNRLACFMSDSTLPQRTNR